MKVPMPIPKKLHYVWLGGRPLPKHFARYVAGWTRQNPTFEILRWDESNIDWTCAYTRAAHEAGAWAKLSDLVRLRAVYEHGGIYLDTDVELVRPLDPLLENQCFFAYQSVREEDEPICNAVFGAAPRDPFLRAILNRFPIELRENFNTTGTGPEIVSALLREMGLPRCPDALTRVGNVTVYPRASFYPYHWTEDFERSCITPDTYGVHHWDMSWHGDKSILRGLIKGQLKRFPAIHRGVRRAYRRLGLGG
ncbi:hypothetical protein AO398_23920 [Methylobacterium sp. GXS13]|nr:hypothetical protein AO398_23920 [Methylobacterium sp. GXS13]